MRRPSAGTAGDASFAASRRGWRGRTAGARRSMGVEDVDGRGGDTGDLLGTHVQSVDEASGSKERSGRRIGRGWLQVEVEKGVGRLQGAVELGSVKPVAGADEQLDAAGHARPGLGLG